MIGTAIHEHFPGASRVRVDAREGTASWTHKGKEFELCWDSEDECYVVDWEDYCVADDTAEQAIASAAEILSFK